MSQVITTILFDDNPQGLRLIETANWSGKAFVVPRGKLKELKNRSDAQAPGVYFLLGEGEEKPSAYIGQSENVVDRLFSHNANWEENEWNMAVLFAGNLDSTFIKYLESISLDLAKLADRYVVYNSASPKKNLLSEAQQIVAEEYFDRIKIIMKFLGYPLFDVVEDSSIDKNIYLLKAEDTEARAQFLDDGSLNVFAGALARMKETESFHGWSKAARRKFLDDGTFVADSEKSYKLTKDVVFSSPSAAAATLTGRSINGWVSWKDQDGNTLDQNVRK